MPTMIVTITDVPTFGGVQRGYQFTGRMSLPSVVDAPIRINSMSLYYGYGRAYMSAPYLAAVCGDTTFRTDYFSLGSDETLKKRTMSVFTSSIVVGTDHLLRQNGRIITFTAKRDNSTSANIIDRPRAGDMTLTIDYDILFQASTFTLSESSVIMGNSVTLNIASNALNASFTHSAKITLGGQTLAGSRTGPGTLTIAIPANDTWQALLPTSTSGKATVTLTTTGNGETGTTSTTATISIPDNIIPTAGTISFVGVNQYWGLQVQGVSKTSATLSGYSGGSGTTSVTISMVGGGYSSTGDSFTTGLLRTVGANVFTATITDSRGRTATTTASIEVVEYARPTLNGITINRCLADGTIDNENGTYVKIVVDCSYTQIGENVLVADIWIDNIRKKVDEPVPLVGPYGDGQLDIAKSYAIKVSVFDGIASRANGANIYAVETLQSSRRIINLYPSADSGIGIGKMAELEKVVDFAEGWGLRVDGAYLSEEVYIGTNEPENQNVKIWINAEGLPWINNGGGSGSAPTVYVSEVSIGAITPESNDVVLWYDTGVETLKAKNNGVWVEVSTKGSGGAKEVFVGATQPTDTSVSLWFDTDTEELKVLTSGTWVAISTSNGGTQVQIGGETPTDPNVVLWYDPYEVNEGESPDGTVPFVRTINGESGEVTLTLPSVLDSYPIGSIYISAIATSPGELFGGVWAQLTDRFLVGAGSGYAAGTTGGKTSYKLSAAIGACNGDVASIAYITDLATAYQQNSTTSSNRYRVAGSSKSFSSWNHSTPVTEHDVNNRNVTIMPPYLAVYMWQRIE